MKRTAATTENDMRASMTNTEVKSTIELKEAFIVKQNPKFVLSEKGSDFGETSHSNSVF